MNKIIECLYFTPFLPTFSTIKLDKILNYCSNRNQKSFFNFKWQKFLPFADGKNLPFQMENTFHMIDKTSSVISNDYWAISVSSYDLRVFQVSIMLTKII